MSITREDLEVNAWFRAKKPTKNWQGRVGYNDRRIVWLGNNLVQYDSETVKDGMRYPKVSVEDFIKWANKKLTKEEVAEYDE